MQPRRDWWMNPPDSAQREAWKHIAVSGFSAFFPPPQRYFVTPIVHCRGTLRIDTRRVLFPQKYWNIGIIRYADPIWSKMKERLWFTVCRHWFRCCAHYVLIDPRSWLRPGLILKAKNRFQIGLFLSDFFSCAVYFSKRNCVFIQT